MLDMFLAFLGIGLIAAKLQCRVTRTHSVKYFKFRVRFQA